MELDLNSLPYFESPQNDDERLLNFQHDYLVKGDLKAWSDLWTLSYEVARRLLCKHYAKRLFSEDDIQDKVSCAVEYVLRRYSTNPGWYVTKSFLSALKYGCKHAMDYSTKATKAVKIWDCTAINRLREGLEYGDAKIM